MECVLPAFDSQIGVSQLDFFLRGKVIDGVFLSHRAQGFHDLNRERIVGGLQAPPINAFDVSPQLRGIQIPFGMLNRVGQHAAKLRHDRRIGAWLQTQNGRYKLSFQFGILRYHFWKQSDQLAGSLGAIIAKHFEILVHSKFAAKNRAICVMAKIIGLADMIEESLFRKRFGFGAVAAAHHHLFFRETRLFLIELGRNPIGGLGGGGFQPAKHLFGGKPMKRFDQGALSHASPLVLRGFLNQLAIEKARFIQAHNGRMPKAHCQISFRLTVGWLESNTVSKARTACSIFRFVRAIT